MSSNCSSSVALPSSVNSTDSGPLYASAGPPYGRCGVTGDADVLYTGLGGIGGGGAFLGRGASGFDQDVSFVILLK